jgi:hypothetical protein
LKAMHKEILFSERQRFRQWWLWLIMAGVSAATFVGLFQNPDGPSANDQAHQITIFAGCGVVLLINALLLVTRLDTIIKEDGLYVRFFPFRLRFNYFSWAGIDQVQLREYAPLAEYGGWGWRLSRGAGKAYTISGNKGIQLLLKDGSKLLIGTSRAEEVKQALDKLGR